MILLILACTDGRLLPTAEIAVGAETITVEVADDGEERAMGLMFRDSLPEDSGMLFVYPDSRERSFWMKNTRIPLSIAFIDATGTILNPAEFPAHV